MTDEHVDESCLVCHRPACYVWREAYEHIRYCELHVPAAFQSVLPGGKYSLTRLLEEEYLKNKSALTEISSQG
jgi:hypothetical protein